jgi:putative dimethyl sulfoxide reductase chaperone
MPTPFELQKERPRRSVFGNYAPSRATASRHGTASANEGSTAFSRSAATLQESIDSAVARTFLYGFLARIFEDPEPNSWEWLTSHEIKAALRSSAIGFAEESLIDSAEELLRQLALSGYEDFAASHLACFGHTVRGDCPMNEIEYGDIKADPLFQPHRLSDLAAFFAAFGLELAPDAAERTDHISIELEFMCVLAAKEAYAIERQTNDALAIFRDAQKKFLREHLGRWSPAFARRLARTAEGTALAAVANFVAVFIQLECAWLNVPAGSEDLLLRPVDGANERLCDSCGLHGLPPGAVTTGAKL